MTTQSISRNFFCNIFHHWNHINFFPNYFRHVSVGCSSCIILRRLFCNDNFTYFRKCFGMQTSIGLVWNYYTYYVVVSRNILFGYFPFFSAKNILILIMEIMENIPNFFSWILKNWLYLTSQVFLLLLYITL